MKKTLLLSIVIILAFFQFAGLSRAIDGEVGENYFKVYPIGKVVKEDGKTTIVLDKEYEPGLLRFEKLSHVTVVWWFHLNDNPEDRSVLQVHPRGNPSNPLTGVFATHSPVRPNLIAITRCKVISVKGNVIEIDGIDAFDGTPVLDLKS
jgi:tRNA-Thr(GGU) m(6)t(6)A37 methyltransferase TsaA